MSTEDLAAEQAALVAALVAAGPLPPGFDATRVAATRRALLRKRAGEVARAWPLLAAGLDGEYHERFARWADGRPPQSSYADGLAFAQALRDTGDLPELGATELREREPRRPFWRRSGRRS